MQVDTWANTISCQYRCVTSGLELVPANQGKQKGLLKQVCSQCNMNKALQKTTSAEHRNYRSPEDASKTHFEISSPTLASESDSELFGLALILGKTLNSDTNRSHQLSDEMHYEDERNIEEIPISPVKEKDHILCRCFSGINRRLLIYKMFYFFFFSAVGALFPYLAVFYKQLWLSAHETGILMGIRPLIQLFGTPMWGAIADTYNKSKFIFMVSLSAWLVSNYSLSLVSPVIQLSLCRDNATIGIVEEILEILKNKTPPAKTSTDTTRHKQKAPTVVDTGKGNSDHWFEIVGQVNKSNPTRNTILRKSKSPSRVELSHLFANLSHNLVNGSKYNVKFSAKVDATMVPAFNRSRIVQNIRIFPNVKQRRRRRTDKTYGFSTPIALFLSSQSDQHINRSKQVSGGKSRRFKVNNRDFVSDSALLGFLNSSQSGKVDIKGLANQVNREKIERVFDWLNMAGEYPWPLDTIADYESTQTSYDWQSQHETHLFTILFFITAVGTLIAAPAITLADTATLQNLDKPEAYGKQRLWGAFGWGLAAFIVGSSLSTIEELNSCNDPLNVDYLPCFYAFACLMGVAFLIGAFFEFDDKKSHDNNIWHGLETLISCQYLFFILTILFCGLALGFIQTFLFWHLQDIGGSQFLFSTITAIHCFSEVMVYSFSGILIKWCGHHRVLYIGLLCYIIRFFAYAFITNSWAVLPFEILHGLSTAAVWSAAVVFVGLIPGASATMQGILGGVHWGLGNGGGGVIGGLLITYAGTTTSFLIFGLVSVLDLILFVCLNNMEYFTFFTKEVGSRSQHIIQDDKSNVKEDTEYNEFH